VADSLKLSEIFESLQGEGLNLGKPCLFVRLALCNLHCTWCDTKYTWDFERFEYEREVTLTPLADVAQRIAAARSRHVVITGGEPLLQQAALSALCSLLARDIFLEIETNGTIEPRSELLARVAQWNVSPKLAHAGDPESIRLRPSVLARFAALPNAYLKLVVRGDEDAQEAAALTRALGWPEARVFLMPEAQSRDELRARTPEVARASLAQGFRFSSRLHLELWDGRRGT
jgi:7-carboxy-7-deazaguanine synthase